MIQGIKFNLNENIFLKDPQETLFGQRLLKNSIELLNEIGFESFTFKKLADKMQSAEASMYRYFTNKHLLLVYLNCWYWEWVNFLLDINLRNIKDPQSRLETTINSIVTATFESSLTTYINENQLHRIMINEGSKSYHIHSVDEENKLGFFMSYKNLVEKVADVIKEVKPDFPYPRSLASNLFEMANNQSYFSEHLPRLTDIKNNKNSAKELEKMISYFTFKILDAN